MIHKPLRHAETPQDRFGLKVAARLTLGSNEVPHDLSERLRVARLQALAQRKRVPVRNSRFATAVATSGSATLTRGDEGWSPWSGLASALPLIALVAGLVFINGIVNEDRANEVAEVDMALLTDDLPPAAYTDTGFIQFLKISNNPVASE